MSIYNVTESHSVKLSSPKHFLKPGQIIQGKILKLFPDNKAQIQLGTQKMIAQLEAPLTLGERYHFQVEAADQVLHLKVLGESLKGEERSNILNLMQQLGLKHSKANVAFMQLLIHERIPFEKNQLINAFQLLNNTKNTNENQLALKEMIARKLPVTYNVFQALSAKNSQDFSTPVNTLLAQLKFDPEQLQLRERLGQLIDRPLSPKLHISQQISSEAVMDKQIFFNIAKASGLVDPTLDFNSWKSKWNSFAAIIGDEQTLNNLKLPFGFNESKIAHVFSQLINNRDQIISQSQEFLKMWQLNINQAAANGVPLSNEDFVQMKRQYSQLIMPFASNDSQQAMNLLNNTPNNLNQFLSLVQTLNNGQTYTEIEHFLQKLSLDSLFLQKTPKDQFLTILNNLLHNIGINYENELGNNNFEKQSTAIKAMLLNLLQQNIGAKSEQAQQLLHFINGMQLQSVQSDNNYFLQASLLVPGERLGLNSDLELEFEGRKMANGEINPDFCHILFYLDLMHLNKTVIDMNIQKRAVSITVFNDHKQLSREKTSSFEPLLKKGLQNIDYHLTSLSFKPLQQKDVKKRDTTEKLAHSPYKGVDYRI
ncbi:hypothetical protein CIL03_04100 [Virgibacillus indicus]|uniref:Flagellar hook-length control protein-like C-terminal domain-containing protein n=1 Tax=Virgibacillus indicus TaxID=2024554 RepID=A0A265NGE5_9BACI|nr:hypothetical protein [Virgibacillus indicus]OZU90336.1 hypothetical protein CIL03_04100 [Virgibacillus indicus]